MRLFDKIAVCSLFVLSASAALAADNANNMPSSGDQAATAPSDQNANAPSMPSDQSAPTAQNMPSMPSDQSAMKNPGACASDKEKFCSGMDWGSGLGKCLQSHSSDLSSACKNQVASMKKEAQSFKAACKSDVKHFCPNVKKGGGQIAQCLKDNADQLSKTCKNEIMSKNPEFFTS